MSGSGNGSRVDDEIVMRKGKNFSIRNERNRDGVYREGKKWNKIFDVWEFVVDSLSQYT